MRILLYTDDSTEFPEDVTEAVKVLYDLALSSMDFRSGFWDAEDAAPVAKLGELCGFENWEDVQEYASKLLHSHEQDDFLQNRAMEGYDQSGTRRIATVDPEDNWRQRHYKTWKIIPHEHVFSSQGKCMWRWCNAEGFE